MINEKCYKTLKLIEDLIISIKLKQLGCENYIYINDALSVQLLIPFVEYLNEKYIGRAVYDALYNKNSIINQFIAVSSEIVVKTDEFILIEHVELL